MAGGSWGLLRALRPLTRSAYGHRAACSGFASSPGPLGTDNSMFLWLRSRAPADPLPNRMGHCQRLGGASGGPAPTPGAQPSPVPPPWAQLQPTNPGHGPPFGQPDVAELAVWRAECPGLDPWVLGLPYRSRLCGLTKCCPLALGNEAWPGAGRSCTGPSVAHDTTTPQAGPSALAWSPRCV